MKIIFNIIASVDYNSFKQDWLENILYFQQNFPEYSNSINFYFTYNETIETIEQTEKFRIEKPQNNNINFYDFYYINNSKYERKRGIFKRNLAFLKYLKLQNINADYIIRTNLSTLFNLELFIDWIKEKKLPNNKLLAATLSDTYMEEFSIFSGTNFLISYDLVETLLLAENNIEEHFNKLGIEYPEDDLLMGQILIQNIKDLNIISINRLDYVECKYTLNGVENYIPPSIIFEKCHYTDKVFCFRFKTLNRNDDSKNLKYILQNHIINKIPLETCINYFTNIKKSLQLILNQPNHYQKFGQKTFKLYEKVIFHSNKDRENLPFFSNIKLFEEVFFWDIKNDNSNHNSNGNSNGNPNDIRLNK